MKVRNSMFAVSGVALSMLLSACNEVKQTALECAFPDLPETPAPGWVCDEPVEGVVVSAVGAAEKSAAGIAFSKNMAETDARVQIALSMKTHVKNMVRQYANTTGTVSSETVDKVNSSVTSQVTDQTVTNARRYKSTVSPNGVVYVLMGINDATAMKVTEEALLTSMNNDKALWQQFKAQKGQDELAADIAAGKL